MKSPTLLQPSSRYIAFTVVLLALAPAPATLAQPAPAASDSAQIHEELRALKQDYEQRIEALEHKIQQMEKGQASTNSAAQATNAALRAREFASKEFQQNTESRELAIIAESAPLHARMEQVLQDYLDTSGYFRAGYGRDDRGGPQVGFQAPGALAKYRLGNEAENYGELAFGKNFYVPKMFSMNPDERPDGTPSGPIARAQVRVSIYNPYSDLLSSATTSFGLPEAWASIGNVVAAQPSMKFWAGSRFYRRQDIHVNDFMFYNMSGTGGGVEDIELPFGKFALAWIGAASTSGFSDLPQPDPANKAGFSKANWDARIYDVPVPLGTGEFGVTYARADSGFDALGRTTPNSDGVAFTAIHIRDKFISDDGVNKFSLQFGTGPAKTFTSGFETFTLTNGIFIRPDPRNSWRFRATEHFTANVSDHFSIGPVLVYQITDYTSEGGMVQWGSAGVRPIWHFNSYVSLACESGVDWVKDNNAGTSDYLTKVTLAPQVSLGGRFMSRPVIRGFVTYAHWGDQFVGQVGGNDYAGQHEGLTYGVQMEVWW